MSGNEDPIRTSSHRSSRHRNHSGTTATAAVAVTNEPHPSRASALKDSSRQFGIAGGSSIKPSNNNNNNTATSSSTNAPKPSPLDLILKKIELNEAERQEIIVSFEFINNN